MGKITWTSMTGAHLTVTLNYKKNYPFFALHETLITEKKSATYVLKYLFEIFLRIYVWPWSSKPKMNIIEKIINVGTFRTKIVDPFNYFYNVDYRIRWSGLKGTM